MKILNHDSTSGHHFLSPFSILTGIRRLFLILIFLILCSASAVVAYTALPLFLGPILLYRQIVKFVVQRRDPKCGPILSGLDAMLASPDAYNANNITMTLSPYVAFSSKLDRAHIVKSLQDKVITPNLFPNLKQRIIERYGYHFWYDVDNFNVEDHVNYLNPENPDAPVTLSEFRRLGGTKVGLLPYDPRRSPWELVLVPNLIDENNPAIKSGLWIRANHCLMDGYSVVYFLQKTADIPWLSVVGQEGKKPKNRQQQCWLWSRIRKFLQLAVLLFTGPFYAFKIFGFTNDTSPFLKKALADIWKDDHTWGYSDHEVQKMDAHRLKQVRSQHQVGVSSVMTALVAESVSRFIKRKCEDGFSKQPKGYYLLMSFPLPGHPDALTNHWSFVRMHIPIRKGDNARKTLKSIHQKYQKFKNSPIPLVNYSTSVILGLCPRWMHPHEKDMPTQTIVLSNIPGPAKNYDMFGYPVEFGGLSGKPGHNHVFVASILSMAGKFWIDTACVGPLCKGDEDVERLNDTVHQVLSELESSGEEEKIGLSPV